MLASGDRLELQAVYADRLANLLGDGGINTPSAAAYGLNPLGGPNVSFANGKGYSLLAQFRHYWVPTLRSQLYASYTSRELHANSDGVAVTNAFLTTGTTVASGSAAAGAKGSAFGIGHALVWSPVRDFDLGLEVTYLRATWNQAAVRFAGTTAANGGNKFGTFVGSIKEDAFIGKVRVQRNF